MSDDEGEEGMAAAGLTAHEERTLIERLQFIPYEADPTW